MIKIHGKAEKIVARQKELADKLAGKRELLDKNIEATMELAKAVKVLAERPPEASTPEVDLTPVLESIKAVQETQLALLREMRTGKGAKTFNFKIERTDLGKIRQVVVHETTNKGD